VEKEEITLVVFAMEVNEKVYEYGLPIDQVHEITRPEDTVKIPGMPDFVEGVMNLRGSIIPVIDCKKRFGLGDTLSRDTTRNIVVNTDNLKYGVIVDNVVEIISVSAGNFEAPPSIAGGIHADFIIGIGKFDGRLIIALDASKILSQEEENVLESIG
jgi:purine-binding chemotaxis protein CheW